MQRVFFYKVWESSLFFSGGDNCPREIFCGLSKEKAIECAKKRYNNMVKQDPYAEVFVDEFEMTDSETLKNDRIVLLKNYELKRVC